MTRPAPVAPTGATTCAGCGAAMDCGRDDPGGCWCARQPVLPAEALVEGKGCLCERCLSARQGAFANAPHGRGSA